MIDKTRPDKELHGSFCFADIPVEVIGCHSVLFQYCADYKTDQTPQHTILIADENIAEEKSDRGSSGKDENYEVFALLRIFCNFAIADDVILFHSSALMLNGKSYLFAAPSGTGKSTHARLWREMLGDQVTMINDDKPFLRKVNGQFEVYGSPWRGKHKIGDNISAPLAGICFLNQGKENSIRLLSDQEKLPFLLRQTFRPESEDGMKNMLRLLIELSDQIPMWHLDCTISREAAELSYKTMRSTNL